MSDISASKFLTFLKWFFLVFVLIAIANLAIEFLLVSRAYVSIVSGGKGILKEIYVTEDSDHNFLTQHSRDIFEGYQKTSYRYSVGPVRDFSKAISFNGATDGRRITSSESLNNKKYQGIMFGASQSWGYFVDDEHLLSQLLMNKMNDVAIDNYSLLGVTLEQIISYWQSVESQLSDRKFVVVIGGVLDIMNYCYFEPYAFQHRGQITDQIGLVSFYNKLVSKLNADNNLIYCNDEADIDNVVQRVLNSIEAILLQAKKNDMQALIVIPPVPLLGSSNVGNFSSNSSFLKMKKATHLVYKELDKRVSSVDSASVINLMHAFDDGEIYFLDPMGHFTERGHEKLAEEIINQVGEDFFRAN